MRQQKHITAILLVLVVFVIGIFIGSTWKGSESTPVERMLKQSELDAESFLIEQELFDSFDASCDLTRKRLETLSDGLWQLGKTLGGEDAEETLGAENYHYLKRKFHLMQTRTYILYKKFRDNCGEDTNIILFYFKRGDPQSTEQGLILDKLVQSYEAKVFAVELNYSKDLEFLEQYYDATDTPYLVINYEHTLAGKTPAEEIIPFLN